MRRDVLGAVCSRFQSTLAEPRDAGGLRARLAPLVRSRSTRGRGPNPSRTRFEFPRIPAMLSFHIALAFKTASRLRLALVLANRLPSRDEAIINPR